MGIRLFLLLLKFSLIKVKNSKQHVCDSWHHFRHPSAVQQLLWDHETTQEAKDSQAFALLKATVPPSQGLHSPQHKKRKVSRLLAFAGPSVLGHPGVWADSETELKEGS